MTNMKKILVGMTVMMMASYAAMAGDMVCWFAPKTEGAKAKAMAEALSKSGNNITPRVATSYGEIVEAMAKPEPQLVFVGSFTQAMLAARATGTPIVQGVDGKELYSGILIYPEGQSPTDILTSSPADISFAIGASSGESSAKAATGGKASIGVTNHEAAVNAVKAGKAKAAVVKNWWWENNKAKFPGMAAYEIPGVSEQKNPDNVLTANKAVDAKAIADLTKVAKENSAAFGAKEMRDFSPDSLTFTLSLMQKGGIDPKTYTFK